MTGLDVRWLGRMAYPEALALQDELVADAMRVPCDTLLLLEHAPVYTIGRTPDRSSLRSGTLPHPVVQTNRGGQATFHGPGQLVGYPIIDLNSRRRDLHHYLRTLEEMLIEILAIYRLPARRRDGLTGVWVEDRKIASIGVGVRKWVTMHGFALNVSRDLAGFDAITPCGIAGVTMTSLSREIHREVATEEFAEVTGGYFARELLARL